MPRARISYGQRVIIEDMRKNGYKAKDICEAIGISSYDYQRELILGFTEDKKYSAMKAQMSLKQEAEMENEKMTAKEYETRLVDLAPKEIQKEEHLIIKTFSFVIVTGE